MINVSSKTPFWYQHSEREREKEGRWILGITNTCIYLSCCWTIKCGPNNKKPTQRILFSALLYGNCRLSNFVFTGNMVIFVLILQYGRKMICFKLNNLKFSRPSCSFFLVLNLAPLDKDYFKTTVANYLSWLSIIPDFHHSEQLMSSKLEIVDYLISLGEKNYNHANCS